MNTKIADLTPKARRTRSALLDAARAELGHQGVAGVTVMAVCARARVGRTSFYSYFEDCDALVSVVAQGAARDIKERFDHLHENIPRGRGRLKACLDMILETSANEPEVIRLVVSLANSVPDITELLQAEIVAELAAFAQGSEEDRLVLAQYLALTVIALAGQIAKGGLPRRDIERHVEFMMNACH